MASCIKAWLVTKNSSSSCAATFPPPTGLACFEVAARHENTPARRAELSLTQSAVSRQIQALEEFLAYTVLPHAPWRGAHPRRAHYGRQVARWLQGLERDTLDVMAHQGTARCRWRPCHLCHALAHPAPAAAGWPATGHRCPLSKRRRVSCLPTPRSMQRCMQAPPSRWQLAPASRHNGSCTKTWYRCAARSLNPRRRAGAALQGVAAETLAGLPLLQQTRPYGWRQWFRGYGRGCAPHALDGPRYELFSMLAVAATHGLGWR